MPFFEGRPLAPEYTVFGLSHFWEMLNLAMLIFPGCFILFGILLSHCKKIFYDPVVLYLSLLSFGSILFLFIFRPTFSMGRDFDLMSLSLLTPALLLLYQLDKSSIIASKRTIIIYILVTFFCTFSFLTTGIKTIPSEKRFYTLLGHRDEGGWVIYASHFLSKGDTASYKEVSIERFKRFPGYKSFRHVYDLIEKGDFSKAVKLAKELVQKEPYNANYIQLMGYVYRETGQYDSSEVYYSKALSLRYRYSVLNQLGQLYIKQGKYDKAIDVLNKAHKLEPDTTSIIETLALAYIHKNEYDRANLLADTLISKDSLSPGASLIKLTIASRKSDWHNARVHYQEFLKHGKGRSDYETMREYYKNLE
jgi:tetratricopeptide (TPR) repeat protein